MIYKKLTVWVCLLLPAASLACSLFTGFPAATPTPVSLPTFEPVTDPLVIEPDALPDAQAGAPYEIELHITHNVTPVGDMSIIEGTLPAGLEFIFLQGEDSARISGTPQESGTFHITIQAWCFGTMVSGQTLEKEYRLVVK